MQVLYNKSLSFTFQGFHTVKEQQSCIMALIKHAVCASPF